MKTEIITLEKKRYHLICNGYAKFELDELCGNKIFEITQQDDTKGINALFKAVSILSEQGELYRRYHGYDNSEILTPKLLAKLTPNDAAGCSLFIIKLRITMCQTILKGYNRQIEENEEIDLVLQEIESKNGETTNKPTYLYIASLVGVQPKEALMMCPGELIDMFELWKRAHQKKEE